MTSTNVNEVIDTYKEIENFLTDISTATTLQELLTTTKDNAINEANNFTNTYINNFIDNIFDPSINIINTSINNINSSINGIETIIYSLEPDKYLTEINVATNAELGGIKVGYAENSNNVAVKLEEDTNKAYITLNGDAVISALGYTPINEQYVLSPATTNTLGGIKTNYASTSPENIKVQTDDDGNAYVTLTPNAISNVYNLPVADAAILGGIMTGYNDITKPENIGVRVDNGNAYVTLTPAAIKSVYDYQLPTADTVTLGGVVLNYVESGANIPLKADGSSAYVTLTSNAIKTALGSEWTQATTQYELKTASPTEKGGIKTGFTTTVNDGANAIDFAVTMSGENAIVPVSLGNLESIGVITTNNINNIIQQWMNNNVVWITKENYATITPVPGTMYYVYE